jgi:hypothetical protein
MRALPTSHEDELHYYVHAGIRPGSNRSCKAAAAAFHPFQRASDRAWEVSSHLIYLAQNSHRCILAQKGISLAPAGSRCIQSIIILEKRYMKIWLRKAMREGIATSQIEFVSGMTAPHGSKFLF